MPTCPRCVQEFHRGAEICPHCGFNLALAMSLFGSPLSIELSPYTEAPHLIGMDSRKIGPFLAEELHEIKSLPHPLLAVDDTSGLLRKSEVHALEKKIHSLEKKLPPLVLSVHIAALKRPNLLRQYSFWLLNNVQLLPKNFHGRENLDPAWLVMLVIDINHYSMAFATGYQAEALLPESSFYHILNKAKPQIIERKYAQAITVLMTTVATSIRKNARLAIKASRRKPDSSPTQ